ncbi:MAG: hypothetical protein LC127_12660 [Chitinophagales bacterium]|nr:hypothetical protein [Chitinophagales bacterium]
MKNKKAQVFHFDLYGKREDKYNFLNENSVKSIDWAELKPDEPNFFFVNKNFTGQKEYEKGVKVDELFSINTSGVKTHDDSNLISLQKFQDNNCKYYYRPFDIQNIEYDLKKVVRHRFAVMQHLLKENIAILFPRQAITEKFGFFVSKGLTDINYTGTAGQFGAGLIFPLYLYPDPTLGAEAERVPNLNMEIVDSIKEKLGLQFVSEKNPKDSNVYSNDDTPKHTTPTGSHIDNLSDVKNIRPLGSFAPIDLLDYIYAVLHSPSYREKYKEFLKIDFPRVPYPNYGESFRKLVALGGEIRQIHLLESPIVEKFITQYPVDGDNVVGKLKYDNGKVFINETQYFDNVPQVAWEFYIGGYQPAQKWLKDRKDRALDFEDISHYQKIIVALNETDRLMKEIDKIEIL